MKKTILILLITAIFSCSEECKDIYNVYKKIEQVNLSNSKETEEGLVIINENTCIEGGFQADLLRINGNYTLTATSDIQIDGTVTFVGNGTIETKASFISGGNVFFLGGGNIEADMGLLISGHARDQNNLGGTIKYCNFAQIGQLDPGIILTQDCENSVECETLGIDDISGYAYMGQFELECDLSNSENGEYKYIKVE